MIRQRLRLLALDIALAPDGHWLERPRWWLGWQLYDLTTRAEDFDVGFAED